MSEPQFLKTKAGRNIAYHELAGQGPGVVFLGGLRRSEERRVGKECA